MLARYYNGDEGHPVRNGLALKWLRLAARLGDAHSMTSLGVRYHNGNGLRRDYLRAAQLYRRAADLGDRWAMHLLGLCYRDGEGVPKNMHRARSWWTKAAAAGEKQSARQLKLHRAR